MARTRSPKSSLLAAWLAENRPERIGGAEWREILERLAPVSESYARKLARAAGVPLDPLVEGVRQDSFEELERTLLALEREYSEAVKGGDSARARTVRRMVIEAKDHARWASRSPKAPAEKKAVKEEMTAWLLVWLENPEVFPAWVRMRKRAMAAVP